MSDAPNSSPTIGDVVDATANASADQAAETVASMIPEQSNTTVVVEEGNDTTAQGLDAAAHMRVIAREEADAYMSDLIAYENAKKAAEKPDVVVIQAESTPPVTSAMPATQPVVDPAPKESVDDSPPMAHGHPYFKPLGRKRNK